ncbi:hypothetical protein, partial [Desulfitobacterium hafniense]|uniref:hypothetical protein n=1 Tax=Desulfitobacterium hafniense TaxID=49338 RepID=UPI001AEC5914
GKFPAVRPVFSLTSFSSGHCLSQQHTAPLFTSNLSTIIELSDILFTIDYRTIGLAKKRNSQTFGNLTYT